VLEVERGGVAVVVQNRAFQRAFELYTDTVYRVAVHNAPTRADAEDVTQEVFEKLLTGRREFADDEHLKAWLIRVTINLCKNLRRDSRCDGGALTDDLPAPERGDGSVLEAVRALPPKYRNAIYLHYYEGYTAAEIGEILGAGQNTVLSWLSRGRETLKKQMIGGFECD